MNIDLYVVVVGKPSFYYVNMLCYGKLECSYIGNASWSVYFAENDNDMTLLYLFVPQFLCQFHYLEFAL